MSTWALKSKNVVPPSTRQPGFKPLTCSIHYILYAADIVIRFLPKKNIYTYIPYNTQGKWHLKQICYIIYRT